MPAGTSIKGAEGRLPEELPGRGGTGADYTKAARTTQRRPPWQVAVSVVKKALLRRAPAPVQQLSAGSAGAYAASWPAAVRRRPPLRQSLRPPGEEGRQHARSAIPTSSWGFMIFLQATEAT
jgi:hypothetical protein